MATPRTQFRVQVPDLAPPDPIRPAALPSDTYARPAPPPINNDLERLASSLGGFSSALMAAGRRLEANAEAERKKAEAALQERRNADFIEWTLSTENDEQIRAYLAGEAPIDGVTDKLYRKYFGGLLGDHFAKGIQDEIEAGNTEIGKEHFDPDKFVLESGRQYVSVLQGDEDALAAFSSKFDAVGDEVREGHRKALSAERTEAHKSIAKDLMRQAFQNAVRTGLEGETLMDQMRLLYTEMGPRMENGAFNLNAAEMDELLLNMLEEQAENPEFAEAALAMLAANRRDLADNELRIGSLDQVQRHSDQVRRIRTKAVKALGVEAAEDIRNRVLMEDLHALVRQDGSFNPSGIGDIEIPNPVDPTNPVKITGSDRRKAAVDLYLEQRRAIYGVDYKAEIATFNASGVKHHEAFTKLEGAYQAGIGSEMSPEQIGRVIEAAAIYDDMPHSYVQAHNLDPKAQEFFGMVNFARKYTDLSPSEIATAVGRVMADEAAGKPALSSKQRKEITAAAEIAYDGWLGTSWGGKTISNPQDVRAHIEKLALINAKLGNPEAAIEDAVKRVTESATIVNGRAVIGFRGLLPSDAENIQPFLNNAYKTFDPAYLEVNGIESATDLTVVPFGRDTLYVARASDGVPLVDPKTGARVTLSANDIANIRAKRAELSIDKAAKDLTKGRATSAPYTPPRTPVPNHNSPAGEAVKSIVRGIGKAATGATQGLVDSASKAAKGAAVPKRIVQDAYSIGQSKE